MNNSDFSRLAKTPRVDRFAKKQPARSGGGDGSGTGRGVGGAGGGGGGKTSRSERDETTRKQITEEQLKEKRAKAKAWKKREVERRAAKKTEGQTQYRDRAKERAMGGDKDYEATKEIAARVGGQGQEDVIESMTILQPQQAGAATAEKITMEASKFLGGDLEHTHLVKGLDFALLKKVRSDIDQEKAQKQEEERAEQEAALTHASAR
eukprot:COSAG01_NODE_15536_length_1326_cov_1.149959_1_plen_207_part_10